MKVAGTSVAALRMVGFLGLGPGFQAFWVWTVWATVFVSDDSSLMPRHGNFSVRASRYL